MIKKQPQPKKAQVHVNIANPVSARREILTVALDTAKLARDVDELRTIKEKKLKTVRKLSRVMKEVKAIYRELVEIHLPEYTGTAENHINFPHQHELAVHAVEFVQKKAKEKPESEKLRDELKSIEDKLKSL